MISNQFMDWIQIGKGCINTAIESLSSIKKVKALNNNINVQTNADIQSHNSIIDYLHKCNVRCDVYSEEKKQVIKINGGNKKVIFIIDPLDNTHLYLRGESSFCSVALMILINNEPVYAFVGDIGNHSTYYCDNIHAYLNGKHIFVPKKVQGRKIILGWAPYKLRSELFFKSLMDISEKEYYIYNFGGQLQTAKIATGNYDAYVEVRPEAINEFCAALIVQRAGGHVSTLKGEKIIYKPGRKQTLIVARTKDIHQTILKQFRGTQYQESSR